MVFQTKGGLQVQMLESMEACRELGIDARLMDPVREHVTEYDVLHLFSVINGNHRVAEHGAAFGVPVVTSALLRSYWTKALGRRSRTLERLVGRLTGWEIKTEYRHIESCLRSSDMVVALGDIERRCIVDAFRVPEDRVRVIPNGISRRFFEANPDFFHERTAIAPGFVLCVASIDPHKNQLGLARALEGSGRKLVLIGDCLPSNEPYIRELTAFDHVHYLGGVAAGDPLLVSAYSAAGVLGLCSHSEVMPLVVLEALAAGTPAIMTKNHCMDLHGLQDVIAEVDPWSSAEIELAVSNMLAIRPEREQCRKSVSHLQWRGVGQELQKVYEQVLKKPRAARMEVSSRIAV